jgi:Yeast cell wall synthesis protein KRE9/KNH1
VEVGLGESVENAYFIKMISAAPGGTVVNYSGRFSISGMTGTFPDTVKKGLKSVDGTEGPATENNVAEGQDPAGAPADGDAGVPYTMQTGPIRYAPMQKQPPTKISAKDPEPLFPTSAVQFAITFLPNPVQKQTITASATFSVESMENTVSAPNQQSLPLHYLLEKFWRLLNFL